jgi:serine/threonine-protein phosphatase 2A regulatory subunit B
MSAGESNTNQIIRRTLNIKEWRFNQFLGEKMRLEDFHDEDNQGYIIAAMKMSENGKYLIIGDKGGRIIIFKRESREKHSHSNSPNHHVNKLNYYFEYNAYEKDFDVHKSIEYNEVVRCIDVLPHNYNSQGKIDILSCGYRTIKLHRVYNKKNNYYLKNNECNDISGLKLPIVKSNKTELSTKLRKNICLTNSTELNNIQVNKTFPEQFIACCSNKVHLFDLNHLNVAYVLFDLNNQEEDEAAEESLSVAKINNYNANLFTLGTTKGNIKVCDFRTTSDFSKFHTNYLDEFSNILKSGFNFSKTLFSFQIMSVHDLEFISDYYLASRHFLSINIWDIRMNSTPVNKFLTYEPLIAKLSYLYRNKHLSNDKFQLSVSKDGNNILTGGYNSMFHVFDLKQKLNTQCFIDESADRVVNTNIVRKINSKGSCFYKKEETDLNDFNYNSKILKHCYSANEDWIVLAQQNCIYSYVGNNIVKEYKTKN